MSSHSSLFGAFPASGKTEWEKAAREELQGENPWQKLGTVRQGIRREPYYDATSTATIAPLLFPQENSPWGPRTWFNCPRVEVTDPKEANKIALQHLTHGADGILFDLSRQTDTQALLDSIDLRHCSVSFILHEKGIQFPALGMPSEVIPGACYAQDVFDVKNPWRHPGVQMTAGPSAAAELHEAFSILISKSSGDAALLVPLTNDFFGDIIKLRVIRMLWNRCIEAEKIPGGTLLLHGWSSAWASTALGPHENMLKGTYAAMAAVLGGCDGITIDPAAGTDPMLSRNARNISNVLREEAHLSKVGDPLAGTWFIENACAQLTEEVWNHLTQKA